MTGMLVQGFGTTLALFALTLVGAIPLGIPVALARKRGPGGDPYSFSRRNGHVRCFAQRVRICAAHHGHRGERAHRRRHGCRVGDFSALAEAPSTW